jgi:selenium metabolism protein YedF
MDTIDCMGLACPQPVLNTRAHLLRHPDTASLTVWVDNRASAENVSRFLENQGFEVRLQPEESRIGVIAEQSCEVPLAAPDPGGEKPVRTLVFITRDVIGEGHDELGSRLMVNFIRTLPELGDALWRIICLNTGVRLAVEGSEVLPDMQRLERQGVSVLVCGTCLTHFGLLENKRVGETTNMLDVVTSLQHADKVISL